MAVISAIKRANIPDYGSANDSPLGRIGLLLAPVVAFSLLAFWHFGTLAPRLRLPADQSDGCELPGEYGKLINYKAAVGESLKWRLNNVFKAGGVGAAEVALQKCGKCINQISGRSVSGTLAVAAGHGQGQVLSSPLQCN